MPLPRTGQLQGTPTGQQKEPKLDRDLKRQYEAAKALAYAGYRVENNPTLTDDDIRSGIRANADPDYRIEGIIFDCYTPAPPVIIRKRAEQAAFALAEVHSEFTDFFEDYRDDDDYDWGPFIERQVKDAVLEGIRAGVQDKVHKRQANCVVLNLTDVRGTVSTNDVETLFRTRAVDRLQRVLVVMANGLPQQQDVATEQVSGELVSHQLDGKVKVRVVSEPYAYSVHPPQNMLVQEVFERG